MRAHQHGLTGDVLESMAGDVNGKQAGPRRSVVDTRDRTGEKCHECEVYWKALARLSGTTACCLVALRSLLSRYIRLSAVAKSTS